MHDNLKNQLFDKDGKLAFRKPIDQDGICNIYYRDLENMDSDFPNPTNIAETRQLNFFFHMQPDNPKDRTAYPHPHPSLNEFKRECPIWHFVDAADEGEKPTCTITIAHHGIGELPDDYDEMLYLLLELMWDIHRSGFEYVIIKVLRRTSRYFTEGRLPSYESVAALRSLFEDRLGTATLIDNREEYRMEFYPQLGKSWYHW